MRKSKNYDAGYRSVTSPHIKAKLPPYGAYVSENYEHPSSYFKTKNTNPYVPRHVYQDTKENYKSNEHDQGGRLHHLTETSSSSGLTVRKRRWRLMGVLNHEATRDPTKAENLVGRIFFL